MAARKKKPPVRDSILDHAPYDAVVGIDISMTMTGIAIWNEDSGEWETSRVSSQSGDDTLVFRHMRLNKIAGDVIVQSSPGLGAGKRYLIVIESPTFTSGGSGFDRAYVWWKVATHFLQNGHHVIEISNTTGKVYTVGRASSPKVEKGEILAQVMKTYPGADVIDDNVADAVGMAAMGARLAGQPIEHSLPQTKLRALDAVMKKLGI